MKAVAFSIKPFEKEYLAKANQKKHDITLISNPLSIDTALYAGGKDAVIVFAGDDVSAPVVEKMAGLGVRYIVTRSAGTDHIDKAAAAAYGIKLASIPSYSPQAIAEHSVALAFALNRQIVKADHNAHGFDFRNDDLVGFNFAGKTVGIIGMGSTGQAAASIYHGLGCQLIAYDEKFPRNFRYVRPVPLEKLYLQSDIISIHLSLTDETRNMINSEALRQMKPGVMLINTSSGQLLQTAAVLAALEDRKIGYLGLDVSEFEKGMFVGKQGNDPVKDPLLQQLLSHPNVLVTPHQAYLTKEALQQIADQTIRSLDLWQQNKCVGKACACGQACRATSTVQDSTAQLKN